MATSAAEPAPPFALCEHGTLVLEDCFGCGWRARGEVGLVLDVDLVDRVAEAMTGFPLDSTVEEDAEAWRATARAAIRVIGEGRTNPAADLIMRLVVTLRQVEARCDKAETLYRENPAKPEAHFATLLTMVRHVIEEGLDGR